SAARSTRPPSRTSPRSSRAKAPVLPPNVKGDGRAAPSFFASVQGFPVIPDSTLKADEPPTCAADPANCQAGGAPRIPPNRKQRKETSVMRTSINRILKQKWILAAVVGAVVFSSAYAFAATLGLTSAGLGAGNASVSTCAS